MAIWKLVSGIHRDPKATPLTLVDVPGIERHTVDKWEPKVDSYYPGDTFESGRELERRNTSGQPPKFEKLAEAPDGLDSLTIEKLRQHADTERMDIPASVTKKSDLVRAIRAYQSLRAVIPA